MRDVGGGVQKSPEQGSNEHFSITLPTATVAELDQLADEQGCSRSAVVREIVLDGIKRKHMVKRIAEAVA